jgi:hypothetical protein
MDDDGPTAAAVSSRPPAPTRPEPITHKQATDIFRQRQAEIFAKMITAAGVADLHALAELPIEQLVELYYAVSGKDTVDALKMRVALLSHLPPK